MLIHFCKILLFLCSYGKRWSKYNNTTDIRNVFEPNFISFQNYCFRKKLKYTLKLGLTAICHLFYMKELKFFVF